MSTLALLATSGFLFFVFLLLINSLFFHSLKKNVPIEIELSHFLPLSSLQPLPATLP